MKVRNHPAIYMAVATILFGTYSVMAKYVLESFEPISAGAYRLIIIAFVITIFSIRAHHKDMTAKGWQVIIINSVLMALNVGLFFAALQYTDAIKAGIFMLLSPMLVYIGSIVLLKEDFNPRGLAGALISLAGGALLVILPALEDGLAFNRGDVILFITTFVMSSIILHAKIAYRHVTPQQLLSYRSVFAGVGLLLAAYFTGEDLSPEASFSSLSALLFVGVIAGALAQMLFFSSLKFVKTEEAASIYYLLPLTTVFLSSLILGERLDDMAIIAGSIIVLGVMIAHPNHHHRYHAIQQYEEHHHWLHKLLGFGRRLKEDLLK